MASIVYIAREIERALGEKPVGNYHIITNKSAYALEIKKQYPDNILLIDSPEILDTYELLSLPQVEEKIKGLDAGILVFKNTANIEELCKEKGYRLINPSATLSEKIENKISQVKWLGELSSLLPPHEIKQVKDIVWKKKPFVLQWSHGHTGDGTLLIQNEKDLDTFKEKFPYRDARITDFIKGPMFTVNIVVTNTAILLGNISYQITGILPFTENAFSTIGNDWAVPHTILTEAQIEKFNEIAEKVAQKMQKENWRGLFGIDVIHDEERDEMHLIEINARQPASTTFESELQNAMELPGINTFQAHINALTGKTPKTSLIQINDGAQILQRLTSRTKTIDSKNLIKAGYKVIEYKNTKTNSDLARIQSSQGIMEAHTKFNKRGKEILELLG